MAKTKQHFDLSINQTVILDILKNSDLSTKFYWTGETLLSHFYLQHRKSLDLDFFTDLQFSYEELIPFLNEVKKRIQLSKIEENKIYDRWEFIVKNHEILRFEFVYYNGEKKRLKPLRKYLGINIDSPEDIAANKVMAYFDRNEPKDLFDLYFILNKMFSLNQLINLVKKKFGFTFNEFMFWSESTKSLKLLTSLKPLIPDNNKGKSSELIKIIEAYFIKKGNNYLTINLS